MRKCSHLRIALTVRVRGLRAHLAIVLWYYSIVVIKEFEITIFKIMLYKIIWRNLKL